MIKSFFDSLQREKIIKYTANDKYKQCTILLHHNTHKLALEHVQNYTHTHTQTHTRDYVATNDRGLPSQQFKGNSVLKAP